MARQVIGAEKEQDMLGEMGKQMGVDYLKGKLSESLGQMGGGSSIPGLGGQQKPQGPQGSNPRDRRAASSPMKF